MQRASTADQAAAKCRAGQCHPCRCRPKRAPSAPPPEQAYSAAAGVARQSGRESVPVDRRGRCGNLPGMARRKQPDAFVDLLGAADRDPLMTAWERTFLAGIRAQIEERGHPWLSEEQSRVLARIALKIGIELPAGVRDLVETEDRRDIMAMAMEARGDPRLTAWEEGFLISVAEAARISRPLTEKQRAVLAKIATKVGTPPPDPVEAEVEDDDETA